MFSENTPKYRTCILLSAVLAACACGTGSKVVSLREERIGAMLTLPGEYPDSIPEYDTPDFPQDSFVVRDASGQDVIVMNAIRDEKTGDMVATETLQAAKVTARFRNVAERHGRVDLAFRITVPAAMRDSRWQLRFSPKMLILDETVNLDEIFVTGRDYRKAQLRGYQQYERFLNSIVTDSTRFIDLHQLNLFIERNLPELYAFRRDSSFVSDERFSSVYGVTERDAVKYYTYGLMVRRNERRIQERDKMFRKYVRTPLQTGRLRLDTVMVNESGDFIYNYVQTIETRPRLKKVDIILSGGIFEQDKKVYDIPGGEPLTFYISSLNSFADVRERYLDQVVSRRVDLRRSASIRFAAGRDDILEDFSDNASEIAKIKAALASLLDDKEFDLDSIVVTAHASPEGSFSSNAELSRRRSRSVSRYFSQYMKQYTDSLNMERGVRMAIDGSRADIGLSPQTPIRFSTYAVAENWALLDELVAADSFLTSEQKALYSTQKDISDPDRREHDMRRASSYEYIFSELYPQLRIVDFNFRLHRRDMEKDTIHTTVLDTAYMSGIQALQDRDYKRALNLLRPYGDFNTALAYCCMDYNASALSILEKLDRTAEVNYMLALVFARQGDDRKAVEAYLQSCGQNSSFVHRGNLDPEISALIRRYALHSEMFDEK